MNTQTTRPTPLEAWFAASNLNEQVLDGSYYVIGYRRTDYERVTVFASSLTTLLRDIPNLREQVLILNVGQVGNALTKDEQRLVNRALGRCGEM